MELYTIVFRNEYGDWEQAFYQNNRSTKVPALPDKKAARRTLLYLQRLEIYKSVVLQVLELQPKCLVEV